MRGGDCSTAAFLGRLGRVMDRVMRDILDSGAGHHIAAVRRATAGATAATAIGRPGGGTKASQGGTSSTAPTPAVPSSGRLIKGSYPLYNGKAVVGKGATCNYSR